jgi:signal transduction histidine kinase
MFSAEADGTFPLKYQWKKNGANIVGATNLSLSLSNLQFADAGNYTMEIQSAYGAVTTSSAILSIIPRFWQTKWFLVLCGLTAAGAIGGTARYMTRKKMQRELQRLEQRHALDRERVRIARDLHDDLGARVTQITLLSELSGDGDEMELRMNTRKIAASSREMAQSLDEIVWAVNPKHDTLKGLIEYLSQSADEFLEDTDIRLHLDIPATLPQMSVSAEIRHQLFLSFREALNNAVKHSDASEIEINVSCVNSQLQITVSDNGKGFENTFDQNGNGLKNMRERLETIGGKFEVFTQAQSGTKITMATSLDTPQMGG